MTLYSGTHNWLCVQKMLNHGLNHGFFLSLFKLISCPIYWIACALAYLNFIFEFKAVLVLPKTASSAQTHESISSIWIVWSTLYVYLWYLCQFSNIVLHICFPFLSEMWCLCKSIHICKSEIRNCPELRYLWLTFNFQFLFSIFVFLYRNVIVVDSKAEPFEMVR